MKHVMELTVTLNGSPRAVPAGTTVTALLLSVDLASQPVLVERNGTVVFPRDFPVTRLQSGDVLEIIRVVAGG